jgi:hypothetical protein
MRRAMKRFFVRLHNEAFGGFTLCDHNPKFPTFFIRT